MTPLLLGRFKSLSHHETYLFALNLHNSQDILENLLKELVVVVKLLGLNNCFISIYESGSSDNTKNMLKRFKEDLDDLGILNLITTSNTTIHWGEVDRIEALFPLRNKALEPLYDDVNGIKMKSVKPRFSKVVFLNDIFFCASDILELILQQARSGAVMACPIDIHPSMEFFYDSWVARTIRGDLIIDYNSAWDLFQGDPIGKSRAAKGFPVQVYSCWNGGIVIDSKPFYYKNLEFRNHYQGECPESECSLFAKDLWNYGFGKIVMIPNIFVAYSKKQYLKFRSKWEEISYADEVLIPFYADKLSITLVNNVSYAVEWKSIPKSVKCFPNTFNGIHEDIDPSLVFSDLNTSVIAQR